MNCDAVKRNFVLLAGLFLPLILVLVLWGAQKITEVSVPDPNFPIVYARYNNYAGRYLDLHVDNEKLAATLKLDGKESDNVRNLDITLVSINAVTGEKKTANILIPRDSPSEGVVSLVIPEPFASMKIVEGETAPDGYRVESSERAHSGLSNDLFWTTRSSRPFVLVKDGRKIAVKARETDLWTPVIFIGWVKP